jgi:hypothetical protein
MLSALSFEALGVLLTFSFEPLKKFSVAFGHRGGVNGLTTKLTHSRDSAVTVREGLSKIKPHEI